LTDAGERMHPPPPAVNSNATSRVLRDIALRRGPSHGAYSGIVTDQYEGDVRIARVGKQVQIKQSPADPTRWRERYYAMVPRSAVVTRQCR
jgi:hypothetical protein